MLMAQTITGSYRLDESVGKTMAELIEKLTAHRTTGARGIFLALADGGIINLDHVITFFEIA